MIYTTTNRTTTSPERWPSLVATFPPFLVFVPPASPFSLSNRFFVLSIVCLYIPFLPFFAVGLANPAISQVVTKELPGKSSSKGKNKGSLFKGRKKKKDLLCGYITGTELEVGKQPDTKQDTSMTEKVKKHGRHYVPQTYYSVPDLYFPMAHAHAHAHPQPPQLMNSPYQNVPPTPFDTAYGASLLPSHLLMGSPMISTTNLPRDNNADLLAGGYNRNNRSFQFRRNSGFVLQSNGNTPYMSSKRSSLSQAPMSQKRAEKNSTDSSVGSHGKKKLQHKKRTPIDVTKKLISPISINYRVLPSGDDTYKTRSLLFENVQKNDEMLSVFMRLIINYSQVESVYVFQQTDTPSKDKESDKDTCCLQLSFLSRQAALDFYNNFLQRLPDFKKKLSSPKLSVSFVSFSYVTDEDKDKDKDKDKDINTEKRNIKRSQELLKEPALGEEIFSHDATRSIAIEFYSQVEQDALFEKLPFLDDKDNKRYILEAVDIISAEDAADDFPANYVILTFINIKMAIEVLDYLKANLMTYSVNECFFVSLPGCKSQRESSATPVLGHISTEGSKSVSEVNLANGGNTVMIDRELESLSDELASLKLEEKCLKIIRSDYPKPEIRSHDDHIPGSTNFSMYIFDDGINPEGNSGMYLHDNLTDHSSIIGSPFSNYIDPSISHVMLPNNGLPVGGFDAPGKFPIEPISGPPFNHTNKVITQSIEDRLNTSARIAAAMGGDADNRTVYIGNINPRSKVEDICNVVRGGILQNVKFIEDKRICFVTFIEASAAAQFCANSFIDPIVLHGNTLRVGWGNQSGPLPKSIALAVTVGANRNVYVSLPEYAFKDKFINDPKYKEYHERYKLPSQEQLRKDFTTYGEIEQINYLKDSHCCWVNFINIASAIRLVEDINHNNGEEFHKKFNNRYEGLIINYGKDRCGNINKNLIAGKGSKFYKKVKKPSYDIRIKKMEEKRKMQEDNLLSQKKNSIQLDSLGISVDRTFSNESKLSGGHTTTEENGGVKQDLESNDYKSDHPQISSSGPIGIGLSSKKSPIFDDISGSDESVISDFENSASKETSSSDRKYQTTNSRGDTFVPKTNLSHAPPRAPSTINMTYKKTSYVPPLNGQAPKMDYPKKYKRTHNNFPNQQPTRPIPGSDVMAQYLAQLQHSTFMYAANILGASVETEEDPSAP
ncbi:uncharacterized protein HLK63_B02211 [Nakaseomyces glabratus]|nr:uncharacterized protein GW608_B02211 [Nakaseomyces glabratus]UCS24259.1 uncharacterized protein HLK63_B02211 [Nakaseomyces glabratus]UCS29489.1 uncharacterized protein HLK64_B02211 [Nakaseomyces glabratus]UCS34718.1 uncharacterized protein HLK62_B02211 [Nakaseomyces glabratus]